MNCYGNGFGSWRTRSLFYGFPVRKTGIGDSEGIIGSLFLSPDEIDNSHPNVEEGQHSDADGQPENTIRKIFHASGALAVGISTRACRRCLISSK